MKGTIIVLLALAGMAFSNDAEAGPFGLEMGMKLEDIGGQPKPTQAKNVYDLSTVPKPHSAFQKYSVLVSPQKGLCTILAIGNLISTNSFGLELTNQFKEMKQQLAATYGKSYDWDEVLPGSIWNKPRDFMMGLLKDERILWSVWGSEYKSTLTGNLHSIGLKAHALNTEKAFLELRYEFSNSKDCVAENKKQDEGAL